MKKIILLFSLALCMFLGATSVSAHDNDVDPDNSQAAQLYPCELPGGVHIYLDAGTSSSHTETSTHPFRIKIMMGEFEHWTSRTCTVTSKVYTRNYYCTYGCGRSQNRVESRHELFHSADCTRWEE